MHASVIQNFLLVSPSIKENKTGSLVRSHWVIMRAWDNQGFLRLKH